MGTKGLTELELQQRDAKKQLRELDEDRRLQQKAEAEAARYRDEKRAAKVRAATPAVPPGVQTFDPRRLRRHARTLALHSANRNLAKLLGESEARRKQLVKIAADERAKAARKKAMGVGGKIKRLAQMNVKGRIKALWHRLQG